MNPIIDEYKGIIYVLLAPMLAAILMAISTYLQGININDLFGVILLMAVPTIMVVLLVNAKNIWVWLPVLLIVVFLNIFWLFPSLDDVRGRVFRFR